MVGIARFAKKAGNYLGNTPAAGTNTLDNPKNSTAHGSKAPPPSPFKDAMDMDVFAGGGYGNDFQDGQGNGFGDDINIINHQDGYRVEYDQGGPDSFHQEGAPPSAGNGSFFGGTFSSDNIEDFEVSYRVNIAGDSATLGHNQAERSMSVATSGGLSRFATRPQEEAITDIQNDNSSRFSKALQDNFGMSTASNSPSDITMNKTSTKPATASLSRFSQGPSSIQNRQGSLQTLADAASRDHSILDHSSALQHHQQVAQSQAGANQTSPNVSSGCTKVSNTCKGGYSLDGCRQEGQPVSNRNGDSHFNKILPLPPRATPGNGTNGVHGQVRPQQHKVNEKPTAFQGPTSSQKSPDIADHPIRDSNDRSTIARFGMDRFNRVSFPKETPAKTSTGLNHQLVFPTPIAIPPTAATVSPLSITPRTATDSATVSDPTKMVSHEPYSHFPNDVTNTTRSTIDMSCKSNNRFSLIQKPDVRRVSLEAEQTPMTRKKVMMQCNNGQNKISTAEQAHSRPVKGCVEATRLNSFVHDPRRVSLEGPGKEFFCNSPMDDAHQAEESQSGLKNDSTFEHTHEHWNSTVDVGQPMEGTDEELCSFEGQSQAFLEAHEKTEDLQSEISADLHKMSVKFFIDYPELLRQCDELLELLGSCEDLELEADEAMCRFDSVISASIPEDEGEKGTIAMEVEPIEPVIPKTAPVAESTTEAGSFISISQVSAPGYEIGSQPSVGQNPT
jgi:hypothetical protein